MLINALVGPISELLDKWIPDADTKAKLAHEIATMSERHAHEIALAQIDVNREDAKSKNWYQSSWRPTVGWICALAFGWHFVFQPIAVFILLAFALPMPPLPEFDMGALLTVLGGMLGLGSLRTYEKMKGVTK